MPDRWCVGVTGRTALQNATVVTPSEVHSGARVLISGDRVVAVDDTGTTARADRVVDVDGRYVLPGLIDLHGDDVERYLSPRPGADVAVGRALADCDRANLAAGVTTKFHAVAFEDHPEEERSLDRSRQVAEHVVGDDSVLDTRVHARCELTDPESVWTVLDLLERGVPELVSVMTHVPGEGQFVDDGAFERRYAAGTDGGRTTEVADRRRTTDRDSVEKRLRRVAKATTTTDVVLASHDDDTPGAVETVANLGATVAEYPVTMAAAERARDRGLTVALGAPNLVRGGSLWDNLAVAEAVDAGVCDCLCSDYRPSSLLEAVFVETGEPLPVRVARVTAAPADAAGLPDRGRVAPGARADLVVVDPDPVPTVDCAFVAGREVYRMGVD